MMVRHGVSTLSVIPFSQMQETFASVRKAKDIITDIDKKYLYYITEGIHAGFPPNMNGDLFPEEELFGESPMGGRVSATWIDKPVLENHDEGRRLGKIVDAYEVVNRKSVDMLDTIDQEKFPLLAKDVREGRITDTSMGVIVQEGQCSVKGCSHIARDESDWCEHMRYYKGKKLPGTGELVYEINYGLTGLEDSLITRGMGADTLSKVREILAQKGFSSREFDKLDDKIMKEFAEWTKKFGVAPENFAIYLLEKLRR